MEHLTEETTKLRLITPAITQKWSVDDITMETKITDGRFNLRGNIVSRADAKKADYILNLSPNYPIAIVEAKDNSHGISDGIQQAMAYAQMLEVPFAFSSNGLGFYEHDFLTGNERQFSMEEFPSKEELQERLFNAGRTPNQTEQKIIYQPYYSSANTFPPRYYQRLAINKTLEAIAQGKNRLLLVMATGTGKTYTAFQIIYRLLKSGLKKKVLYLADRNILVDQSIQQDFKPLEKTIHKVNAARDNKSTITSYEIYFSLYQQLVGENGKEHFKELFDKEFFDLIIVDECHRGSASADNTWRKILEYFSSATQIGMTATPKETKYTSNIDYFGKPVYSYSLKEGIEDGFLAPFRVINIKTNIGEGWRPLKGQTDSFGHEIPDKVYSNKDFDYTIILEDRVDEVAREITSYLKNTDRMAKTIVFCASEDHALRMRNALAQLNSDLVKENPDYVVRITGSDDYGKAKLDYFISTSSKYPVIATTSELLSTGVDCKMTKLIVLDKIINSMTAFKQIIGRGTRIREDCGKTHFTIMDFRNVTQLFADPAWDGQVEIDPSYPPKPCSKCGQTPCICEKPEPTLCPVCGHNPCICAWPPPPKPIVSKDGCLVHIIGKIVSVYDTQGKLLRQENIIDYTKHNILGKYASLENFITEWTAEEKKDTIRQLLKEQGIDLEQLKADNDLSDVDDFDFICHIAYGVKDTFTRKERAANVRNGNFLNKYTGQARQVLETLLDRYMNEGIYDMEDPQILQVSPLDKLGTPARIVSFFGGRADFDSAIQGLTRALYNANMR